ncbi:secreted and transmembrane protein 1 isoform X2 [Dasypus novemcinctus]|uniref:secreted and transmembrane protein 1 isoform X2 n=1 Tax=Dasypus novemcinctus TaxID=9361 RepID=UPI0026602F68|nr:secreted and transmembrane protein 1 isoform X2 [Dasypus novemcinctus]
MACHMSNAVSSVTLELCVPGNHCSVLFSAKGPGDFSHEGWRLQVGGRGARLVIEHARASQAGTYRWHLEGLQRSVLHTWLNVSATAPAASAPAATASAPPGDATDSGRPPVERPRLVAVVLTVLAAAVAGSGVLALCLRYRSLWKYQEMQNFSACRPP